MILPVTVKGVDPTWFRSIPLSLGVTDAWWNMRTEDFVEETMLKGKSEPVVIYQLVGE